MISKEHIKKIKILSIQIKLQSTFTQKLTINDIESKSKCIKFILPTL